MLCICTIIVTAIVYVSILGNLPDLLILLLLSVVFQLLTPFPARGIKSRKIMAKNNYDIIIL